MANSGFLDEDTRFDEIEKLASQGGTSEAFLVKVNGKALFMKRLRPEHAYDPKFCSIFKKEYELGRSLESPYFPKYIDIDKDKNGWYILSEYILGENIEERLEKDPAYFREEKNIYKLLLQLLEGLKELHRRDIVYMDINPGNIMLTKFGNNVKITDLGFCANATYLHTAGGTPGFTAPEIKEHKLNGIDAQNDIFSTGMLLRYIKERSGAEFSHHLNRFMQRCLKRDRAQRFKSAEEAITALQYRHKWPIVTALASSIAIAVVAMLGYQNHTRIEQEEPQTATFNGVDYRILSKEDFTCAVVGGESNRNNIYIEPEILFGNNVYRTVAIIDSAFQRRNILSVHIPEGIEFIGHGAFYRCDSIITINLPASVKDFDGAFAGMESLQKVKLPAIKQISSTAFVDIRIKDLHIPEGVERICRDAFVSCTKLKNVSLPQTLKIIERGIFYKCTALEEIVIPAQVEEIGDYAFFECDSLHSVYCHATTPPHITTIFNKRDVKVYVPEEAIDAYKKDFSWREYNILPMPENRK